MKLTRSENGFNLLINETLNSLIQQERTLRQSEHKESSNGFRPRRWSHGPLEFSLQIPRTRKGTFHPALLSIIRSEDDEKAKLFSSLYHKGMTTKQIGEVAELLYGRSYSKQRVSQLTTLCKENIAESLERRLSKRYLVVYIDATAM